VGGAVGAQFVNAEYSPDRRAIVTEYSRLTGVRSLINTSFNMHEEPIVATAADAIRTYQRGGLDALALGDVLIGARGD
jgi:carbamoyltransferase